MYIQKTLLSTMVGVALTLPIQTAVAMEGVGNPVSPEDWYEEGKQAVDSNKRKTVDALIKAYSRAKNIILFVGDGMGISTVTAARILEGQMLGLEGEEHELYFEMFPQVALSKTYNTNQQTPDSAGTMTAMMTGIKTKAGVISVNQNVTRGDCSSQPGTELVTALELAEIAGMSTGVVSTARITHATPAATYAHIMERNFEDDRDAANPELVPNPGECKDIAQQLIDFPDRFKADFPWVDGLEVALGGGRRSFLEREEGIDPEDGATGEREDGRDLVTEWQDNYSNAAYVWNQEQFDAVDSGSVDHLLGLFEMSHMEYEADRETDVGGEPSLSEMTAKAIEVLKKNEKGFFLHVESGRIDHGHHATNPYRALTDTIEYANAVKTAYEMTDSSETLIIVTADHSHVFTIAGYPTRGNPILGKVVSNDAGGNPESEETLASDSLPYTTLGYTNGRGFHFLPLGGDTIYDEELNMAGRADLTGIDTMNQGFHSETVVPLEAETHGGEDVAIYASGPGSSLVNGLMEQNAIYHVMNKAGRLEARAQRRGWKNPRVQEENK